MTHWDDCWNQGPEHYECAVEHIRALEAELAEARRGLGDLREASALQKAELDEAQRDVAKAAGELLVEMPEPGTDMARVMIANSMMRRERDEARAALTELIELLDGMSADEHCSGWWEDIEVALRGKT